MTSAIITAGEFKGVVKSWRVLNLALQVAEIAREVGLTVVNIRSSHNHGSASRYIRLRDRHDRIWFIRVSNHSRPMPNAGAVPHLDWVSLDARSGLADVAEFLLHVADDQIEWRDCWDAEELKRLAREFERSRR